MSIIHGSWIVNSGQDYFFVWGETWRSLVNETFSLNEAGDFIHPFDLSQSELLDLFQSQELDIKELLTASNWQKQLIGIPTIITDTEEGKKIQPVFAGDLVESESNLDLYLWEVEGFRLTPSETINLLQVLSLASLQASTQYLAGDICFWSHIYRWVLDLIVRQKYLPGIAARDIKESTYKSIWQPLIDSEVDRVRLAKFTQTIPEACLAYLDGETSEADTTDEELVLRSLWLMLDARLRTWIDYEPSNIKEVTVQPWLRSLSESPQLAAEAKSINRLSNALYNWTLPIREYLVNRQNQNLSTNRYRVCFVLTPPTETTEAGEQNDWQLNYYLQALDDPDFVVEAAIIWQCAAEFLTIKERTLENPQETLLKGLGLATRIYEPIKASLEQSQPSYCLLNPIQVYEFIRAIAWQLQDNGLGVIVPTGLTPGNNEQRLGIKMTASVNQRQGERLSLQSLLKYKLEIAVGERTVSKRDFKKLLAQKSPIVEIDGQWIALQPADVKAAQAVLDQSNEQLDLSVEDALRLSTGDTKTLAKLPVVKFEATGVLSGLLDNLTDNKAVEPVKKIKGFTGELRPYQAKGVGWLSFLETWGLGACLADDMGLGKCVLPNTKLQVNGIVKTAAEIWQEYSQATQFDGEGYWSHPQQQLWVNSLDETTGKIVLATISNLYRQQIQEKVVKVNLEDGNSITITKRHKLLTNNGWQNNLQAGDYVCVPSNIYGNNYQEDCDLVKLLAWQIAEGWENKNRATVNIFQKSTSVLLDLHQAIVNLANKYQFKIYNPKVRIPNDGKVSYLSIVVNCINDVITGQAETNYRQLKPSKWTQKTLIAYQQLDKLYLAAKKQELQNLLDREVFYCRIKSIEEIDYQGWVYDFEVPVHHNFVANNIICHNTIQLIAFLLNLKQQNILTKPTLLVCPTSVINNWEREVKKFAPTLKTLIHHGEKREQGKTFAKQVQDKQLIITSYSLVYRDAKTLSGIEWQGVVLDEAQNIKNPTAKQSQAVREIPAGFRIALTGTPVENRLAELWSILDFLNPGFLGNRNFFQKRFAAPIEKYGDRESLSILRSLTQPFILRRLKTDQNIIQDLPEKQEMNVFCGLSAEQADLYQQLVDNSLAEIEDSEGIKRRGLILTLLLRLKQLCNHPELLKETDSKKIKLDPEFGDRSGKLLRLEEMLEEIVDEGDRALIFTQFSEWGKMLKPYLEAKLKGEVLFLYGSTRRQARQEMVDRFQHEPNGPKIFILSLKAGGTGLNLTRANHVFHVDRWWNPAVENQATDRAFRIGQKRNVQVHKFVCTGTLEERINDIIESKKELAEQTVNAGEQWLTDLDTNSLRDLLLLDRDAIIDE
jgi:SNF2 family DNA or RNA helicase